MTDSDGQHRMLATLQDEFNHLQKQYTELHDKFKVLEKIVSGYKQTSLFAEIEELEKVVKNCTVANEVGKEAKIYVSKSTHLQEQIDELKNTCADTQDEVKELKRVVHEFKELQ